MIPSKDQVPDHVIQFLLTEFNAIGEEIRRTRSEALNRLNFFITITSGILGGIALLFQVGPTSAYLLKLFSLGALILLMTIGLDTFKYLIARDINSDVNVRASARIRRFFMEQYPPVEHYLTWQYHDEPTKWVIKNTSGSRSTTQSIISVLCALAAGLVVNLFSTIFVLTIIATVVSFAISFFLLHNYAHDKFKQATHAARESVRFPTRDDKLQEVISGLDREKN